MPDYNIRGTIITLPESAGSPNWAPALLAMFTAIQEALELSVGEADIAPQVLNIDAFNNATNQDVIGLAFSPSVVRSAEISYYVFRETTTNNAAETGTIYIEYNANNSVGQKWLFSRECVGNGSIDFNITDAGQVQFTTTALAGSSHTGSLGFLAKSILLSN
jgi:hypothetical protein